MDTARRMALILATDLLMDGCMLAMALRILNVRIRLKRVCFAAFFGSCISCAAAFLRLSRPACMALWLPSALGMMRLGAGRAGSLRASLSRAAVLFACAGYLGGVVLALEGAAGQRHSALIVGAVLATAVFVICNRCACRRAHQGRVRIECIISGRRMAFDAIVDSGNSLRDYLTHRPVIVAPGGQACLRLPARPIFAQTAGGRQMMLLVVPQETIIHLRGERRRVAAALAFSPGLKRGTPALAPAALFEP